MAAGSTYTPIATTTLGSASSSVTFSSIAGIYTDLRLIMQLKSTAGGSLQLRFNGSTSGYSRTYLAGDGSTASSGRSTNNDRLYLAGCYGTNQETHIAEIMNYANTSTAKTVLAKSAVPSDLILPMVGLWNNTSAITSIVVTSDSTTFITGSMFTLYGIAAA
jgi:hypothetical protein